MTWRRMHCDRFIIRLKRVSSCCLTANDIFFSQKLLLFFIVFLRESVSCLYSWTPDLPRLNKRPSADCPIDGVPNTIKGKIALVEINRIWKDTLGHCNAAALTNIAIIKHFCDCVCCACRCAGRQQMSGSW